MLVAANSALTASGAIGEFFRLGTATIGQGGARYLQIETSTCAPRISSFVMSDDATNVWDDVPDWGGVGARRIVRSPTGTLGISIWEFQPGGSQFVYHFHHGSEELLVVLRGTPTVRMQDGDHELREGDVVPFPRGPQGGHQIRNDGESPARVLLVSTNANPDVAEYPETGKLAAIVDGQHRFHRAADAVEHSGPE